MKKLSYLWIILLLLTAWGCGNKSTGPDPTEEASAQKQFVWNAMNYWYYWQGNVPELADDYFSNDQDFQTYLKNYRDAEALFNGLLYAQADDFSFFIDDYEEFEQSQQGISESFGYEYGLVQLTNSNSIFGYVQYVLPDSPAEDAGLVRGNIFTQVDGTQLTVNNYRNLLFGTTSYELGLAEIQNDTLKETGETVQLQAVTLQENPIFTTSIIDTNSTKVGYLMYNAFQTNSHDELNDAFGNFKSQGIDELVLDLRYNGGGAGITSQTLAGFISGLDSTNVFAKYTYNDKRSQYDRTVNIVNEVTVYENGQEQSTEPMNQLSLDKLYVLTGRGTASASELLINGLKPYMEVVLIGRQTVGKDEGSYTLYDSGEPYFEKPTNPDQKIAIQPIVLKLVNKNDLDYPDGFVPDYEVNELNYLESGLSPLGSVDEPLLSKALEVITGQQQMAKTTEIGKGFSPGDLIIDSRDLDPYGKQLYLQPPKQLK